jgi:hypothetical protein
MVKHINKHERYPTFFIKTADTAIYSAELLTQPLFSLFGGKDILHKIGKNNSLEDF